MKIAVVGGGIIGYASAEALIRAGHSVTIYDARREGDATEVSAGILGAQFESDPESERFSPEQFSDRLEARSKYATWLKRLESETGRSVGFEEKKGVLRIARSEEEGAALKRLLQWQGEQGQKAEWFDRAALRDVHADLEKGLGAAFFPDDAVVDPAALRGALSLWVSSRAQVLKESVNEIAGLLALEYDRVVDCRGAWANNRANGEQVRTVKGQIATFVSDVHLRHVISLGHTYAFSRSDGRMVVGATMEWDDPSAICSDTAWEEVTRELVAFLPTLKIPNLRGFGLRPYLSRPVLREISAHHWVNTGHFRNGVLLAPLYAERLAATIAIS